MTTIDRLTPQAPCAQLAAREQVLRLLALAASDPSSARFELVHDEGFLELALAAADFLAQDERSFPVDLAPGESAPSTLRLTDLVEALQEPRERLEQDHVRVFGLVVSKECPPYEVQYCPQTFSVYRSQRLADIAGFYRAFGLAPGRDAPERADHLACELEFQAWLVAKERHAVGQGGESWEERAALCRGAQRSFAEEHLAWWVPAFAHALLDRTRNLDPPPKLQVALAGALASYVPIERAVLGVPAPDVLVRAQLDEADSLEGCNGCSGSPD